MLSVIQFLAELSLVKREVPIEILVVGQAIRWLTWMLVSLPAILFASRIKFNSVLAISYHILLGISVIISYLVIFNAVLFMMEGVAFEASLFLRNLKVLLADEAITLPLFYVGMLLGSNYLSKKHKEIVLTQTPQYPNKIKVKTGGITEFVNVEDIDCIEAYDYCVKIRVGDKEHILRDSMTGLEQALNPNQFMRIHRSSIVNKSQVKQLVNQDGQMKIILSSGQILDVSKRKLSQVKSTLQMTGNL